uniref:Uncharacterized protein n=1 Tax=Rhizophora mucronata TaxID=61149 RepID=A0A2P2PW26_RHIMU
MRKKDSMLLARLPIAYFNIVLLL